ncbi:MAG: GAF domain-containing protein, partial [Chloroflexi bacterium]|nr:GAF domain-containing protein [Chloroflexota bacterium]
MNDQRKTKKQLLEDLALERERSNALQEVSKRVAAAHDTDEVLDLIVNEATRLLGATGAFMRLLEGDVLVPSAATDSVPVFSARDGAAAALLRVGEGTSATGHVMATKEPLVITDLVEDSQVHPSGRLTFEELGFHGSAFVPLLASGRSVGVLTVVDTRIRRFTEDEVSLLAAFADQASLALEKARLLNEAEREKERAETERERSDALYRVSNLLAGAHETDEVLDLIVNEAARLVGATAAWIRLLEGDSLVLAGAATKSVAGFLAEDAESRPAVSVEEQATVMAQAVVTKRPIVVEDAAEDLSIEEVRLRAKKYGFHGFAVVPLMANDRSIGVLNVMDKRVRRFTDDEVSLLSAFADQASLALEKARLLHEAEREKERSDALYRVSNLLAGAHDTGEVLDVIVNEAARLLSLPIAYIRLVAGKDLVASAATTAAVDLLADLGSSTVIGEGTTPAGHVMATKKAFVVEEISQAEFLTPELRSIMEKHGLRGGAIVPLVANDQSLGVLVLADTRPRRFTEDEVSLLTAFADQASLALEKARLLNEAEARERQATQLYEVTTQLASSQDMDSVLDLIAARAVDLLGCEATAIFEYDPVRDGLAIVRTYNFPLEFEQSIFLKPGESTSGLAFQQRKPVWTRDRLSSQAFTQAIGETIVRNSGVGGTASVPIIIRGQPYGVLNISFFEIHDFTDGEIQLLQTLADSAAVAIGNARFIRETQQARDEATQLYEITEQLASATDMDSVLDLITTKATEMLGSLGSSILKFDETNDSLLLARTYNVAPVLQDRYSVKPGKGVSGVAFLERRPVWSSDITSDQSLIRTEGDASRALSEAGLKAVLAVPIVVRDEAYGVLNVIYQETRDFTDAEIQLLSTLADSAAVAIG